MGILTRKWKQSFLLSGGKNDRKMKQKLRLVVGKNSPPRRKQRDLKRGATTSPGSFIVSLLLLWLLLLLLLQLDFGAGGLPLRLENALHLLALPLAANVGAEALLREL